MPERLSSASGFKAPMIAVRQLHMLSCDTAQHLCPAAVGHRLRCLDHVTRHRDHQVGALDSGQRLAAAADQVDLHTEQLNGCGPFCYDPTRCARCLYSAGKTLLGRRHRLARQSPGRPRNACVRRKRGPLSGATPTDSGGHVSGRIEAGHDGSNQLKTYFIDAP